MNLRRQGKVPAEQQRLAVIDFDLPSSEKRFWVLDLAANRVLYRSLVAHGNNSGQLEATQFSNLNGSNASSLGFYVTGSEYVGKHGRSLRLNGLDPGFNDQAAARAIVVHGADYVSEAFIKQTGRLGRSQGCPALPLELFAPIIDTLKGEPACSCTNPGPATRRPTSTRRWPVRLGGAFPRPWLTGGTPSVFQRRAVSAAPGGCTRQRSCLPPLTHSHSAGTTAGPRQTG
ncbi:murein L,D-transpeptidase catalytic domain family protein [Hymenobacter humi]|uniref:Murein L,D-transpeptidase catalytic domain family protein n=1 Tax=Hymenobacter humi TaxID=1411620 RepID=A0ABW2UB39_9BACT